jgi:hypothetical protein
MAAAFEAVRDDDGEPIEIMPIEIVAPRAAHKTAQSTVDAFWYVVRQNDPARLKAWLLDHPYDAATLLKLLDAKRCR